MPAIDAGPPDGWNVNEGSSNELRWDQEVEFCTPYFLHIGSPFHSSRLLFILAHQE
jgi:hypothetical protein